MVEQQNLGRESRVTVPFELVFYRVCATLDILNVCGLSGARGESVCRLSVLCR